MQFIVTLRYMPDLEATVMALSGVNWKRSIAVKLGKYCVLIGIPEGRKIMLAYVAL